MTARNTWKFWEWQVGKDLGGERIAVTGKDRDAADVVTPMFHCQLKLRKELPAWLFEWMGGIVGTTPDDKVGVLILRKPRQKNAEALVIMRYGDFQALHGTPETKQ